MSQTTVHQQDDVSNANSNDGNYMTERRQPGAKGIQANKTMEVYDGQGKSGYIHTSNHFSCVSEESVWRDAGPSWSPDSERDQVECHSGCKVPCTGERCVIKDCTPIQENCSDCFPCETDEQLEVVSCHKSNGTESFLSKVGLEYDDYSDLCGMTFNDIGQDDAVEDETIAACDITDNSLDKELKFEKSDYQNLNTRTDKVKVKTDNQKVTFSKDQLSFETDDVHVNMHVSEDKSKDPCTFVELKLQGALDTENEVQSLTQMFMFSGGKESFSACDSDIELGEGQANKGSFMYDISEPAEASVNRPDTRCQPSKFSTEFDSECADNLGKAYSSKSNQREMAAADMSIQPHHCPGSQSLASTDVFIQPHHCPGSQSLASTDVFIQPHHCPGSQSLASTETICDSGFSSSERGLSCDSIEKRQSLDIHVCVDNGNDLSFENTGSFLLGEDMESESSSPELTIPEVQTSHQILSQEEGMPIDYVNVPVAVGPEATLEEFEEESENKDGFHAADTEANRENDPDLQEGGVGYSIKHSDVPGTKSSCVSVRAKKRKKQKAKLDKLLAKHSAPRDRRNRKFAVSFQELIAKPEDAFHPDFTCAVCLDLFHRPHVVMPCQHMFCEPCLRKLPTSALGDNSVCPLCRQDIHSCVLDADLHVQLSSYYVTLYQRRSRQERKLNTYQKPLPRIHTPPLSEQIIRQIFRNNQLQNRTHDSGLHLVLSMILSAVLAWFYAWINVPIEITGGPVASAAVSNIWVQAMCLFVLFTWLIMKLLQTFVDEGRR